MAFKDKLDSGGGDIIKFNKIGDTAVGVYLGSKLDLEGKFGPTLKHVLKTDGGMGTIFAKPNSQLSSMLSGEEGNKIKITFSETKPSGKGNPTKIYKVAIDDSFKRLAPEYLLQTDSEDSDSSTETAAPAGKNTREEILARLKSANRK